MSLQDMIFSLFTTLISYLLIPIVLSLTIKRKLNIRAIKIITIINASLVWFAFCVLKFLINGAYQTANIGVAFLWGTISYYIMKRILSTKDADIQPEPDSELPIQETQSIATKPKKISNKNFPFIIASVLFILVLSGISGYSIYQYNQISNLKNEVHNLNIKKKKLESRNEILEQKVDLLFSKRGTKLTSDELLFIMDYQKQPSD